MTLKEVIKQYMDKGFGSMNKNDFEVYIFSWLIDNDYKGKNDYQISLDLKIPITKVKRLRYEASLKYPKQIDYKTSFIEAMKSAKYNKEQITFVIEEISLRQYLRDKLMQRGNFFDSSFNSEIVKITNKDFLALLEDLYLSDENKKKIKDIIEKNSNQDIPHYVAKIISSIVGKIGGEALSELTTLGIDSLIPIVKTIFKQNTQQ
jgi:hypothetical protein